MIRHGHENCESYDAMGTIPGTVGPSDIGGLFNEVGNVSTSRSTVWRFGQQALELRPKREPERLILRQHQGRGRAFRRPNRSLGATHGLTDSDETPDQLRAPPELNVLVVPGHFGLAYVS
jgi:hypothetical protein